MISSFAELIDRFGIGPFAELAGVSYGAAKQMRRRDSVAPEYWPAIIAGCRAAGFAEVNADLLVSFVARMPRENEHEATPVGVAEQHARFEHAPIKFITLEEAKALRDAPPVRMTDEQRKLFYRELAELAEAGRRLPRVTDMTDDEILGYDQE